MRAALSVKSDGIMLSGELGFADARRLQAELEAAVQQVGAGGYPVCLDLADVTHANSVGLSLILSAARAANAGRSDLRLRGLPAQLQSMAAVCGLDDWLAEHADAAGGNQQESS